MNARCVCLCVWLWLQSVDVVVEKTLFPGVRWSLRLSSSRPCSAQVFRDAFTRALLQLLVLSCVLQPYSCRSHLHSQSVVTSATVFSRKILPNSAVQFAKFRKIPWYSYISEDILHGVWNLPQWHKIFSVSTYQYYLCIHVMIITKVSLQRLDFILLKNLKLKMSPQK